MKKINWTIVMYFTIFNALVVGSMCHSMMVGILFGFFNAVAGIIWGFIFGEPKVSSFIILLCLGLSFLTGCGDPIPPEKHNIVTAFLHEPGHYSVMYKEGSELITTDFRHASVKILIDVPENESPYYVANHGTLIDYTDVTIHIKSINDLNGAGWNVQEGKVRRSGTTVKLEVGAE